MNSEPQLATQQVKKVWGGSAPVEPEQQKPAENPTPQIGGASSVVPTQPPKQEKPKTSKQLEQDAKTKAKEEKAKGLFAGVGDSSTKKNDSDSDSDEKPAAKQQPVQQPPPQQDVMDLIGIGSPAQSVTQPQAVATKPYTPSNMTTPEFAQVWGGMANDRQIELQTQLTSPEAFQ